MTTGRWTDMTDIETIVEFGDDARDTLARARDGARQAARGISGLARTNGRGRYAGTETISSGWLFHTVGDRKDAVVQLAQDWAAFQNDLAAQLGWTTSHPSVDENNTLTPWWRLNVVPVLDEWEKWKTEELDSWFTRFATSWDSIEAWRDRLVSLRDQAEKAGFTLHSNAPTSLPTTAWGQLGEGLGSAWRMVRTLTFAGIALGGTWVLYTIYKDVRRGK